MASDRFPRGAIRKLENREHFPLVALGAVREIRAYVDEVERMSVSTALELGAGAGDIADALGITRQGAYYKIRSVEQRREAQTPAPASRSGDRPADDVVILKDTGSPPHVS